MTAKRMLANYMGKATPNGMDPAHAAKLSVKVCCTPSRAMSPAQRETNQIHILMSDKRTHLFSGILQP